MRIKILNIAGVILILMVGACEEKYWPDLGGKYQNILVVDGMITNEPGPYIVRLSLSSAINGSVPNNMPAPGYQMTIMDDRGNAENLYEINPGIFSTPANGMQGIVGRRYSLEIISPSGGIYQSAYELLRGPTGIASVYSKTEYHHSNETSYDLAGYQFYLDTEVAPQDSSYYLWNMTATWQYQADLKIRYIFDGTLRPFFNSDSLRTCWKTEIVKDIYTYTTAGLSQSVLTGYPLHFVSTETRELSIRYSLLVRQLSISEGAYIFWYAAQQQNADAGNLYTRQPYQIQGNVKNVNNPNEQVLGYFMTAGVSEKRIFVNRPPPTVKMRYDICVVGEGDVENFRDIFYTDERFWPVYATFDVYGRAALPSQVCMNCELSGGVIQKPEFWIDF
jgi:hypothetical protein